MRTAGAPLAPAYEIVLKPVSHPELGDIGIDESLFAVGRTEPPFDAYPPEVVSDLSRRHARIFCENGVVHVADMGSKNGTTVNGVDVRQKTARLQHGDAIRFGRTLAYRVELAQRPPAPTARLVGLTLQPTQEQLGLQPIVVVEFPFLIGKADAAFARYKEVSPQQVNYLSRRHAHVFLKRGMPCVEDLGSTNGTFVNGKRLDEHAVPLKPGDTLAFGGHHFVYQVSLQTEDLQIDPTLTRFCSVMQGSAAAGSLAEGAAAALARDSTLDPEKTTFIAAANSFLDIFCIDPVLTDEPEAQSAGGSALEQSAAGDERDGANPGARRRPRSRWAIVMHDVASLLAGPQRQRLIRRLRWGAAGLAGIVVLGVLMYAAGSDVRQMKDLVARGDHARAASLATAYLRDHPENGEVRALGTEALLKAELPPWLDLLAQRQFDRAQARLAAWQAAARSNADLAPLLRELDWIGGLEQFFAAHAGADAPIRLYADEDRMAALLKQWDDDPLGHQRALGTIAVHVPGFRETYAQALSHLRKLQSDNAVYLAAIDRLKAGIVTELQRGRAAAIEPLLRSTAEKYPRLSGLEPLRADLQRFTALDTVLREGRLGPIVNQLGQLNQPGRTDQPVQGNRTDQANPADQRTGSDRRDQSGQSGFATPPFKAQLQALAAAGRLPSADLQHRYGAVQTAWRAGDVPTTLTLLRNLPAGTWAPAVAAETSHKQQLAAQFAALEQGRGSSGREERLMAFYEILDPDEDGFFMRAVEGDAGFDRNRAVKRAQQRLQQAATLWQRYRQGGTIDDADRQDESISDQFRAQSALLAQSLQAAQQGLHLQRILRIEPTEANRQLAAEVAAEAGLQRSALLAARATLAPAVLKEKLALIDASSKGRTP